MSCKCIWFRINLIDTKIYKNKTFYIYELSSILLNTFSINTIYNILFKGNGFNKLYFASFMKENDKIYNNNNYPKYNHVYRSFINIFYILSYHYQFGNGIEFVVHVNNLEENEQLIRKFTNSNGLIQILYSQFLKCILTSYLSVEDSIRLNFGTLHKIRYSNSVLSCDDVSIYSRHCLSDYFSELIDYIPKMEPNFKNITHVCISVEKVYLNHCFSFCLCLYSIDVHKCENSKLISAYIIRLKLDNYSDYCFNDLECQFNILFKTLNYKVDIFHYFRSIILCFPDFQLRKTTNCSFNLMNLIIEKFQHTKIIEIPGDFIDSYLQYLTMIEIITFIGKGSDKDFAFNDIIDKTTKISICASNNCENCKKKE
jgi:hypothetical protein